MCLTSDISEKVTDHSKSKDGNGDAECQFFFFIANGNEKETAIWEDMPTEIFPTDLKTCIHTKAACKKYSDFC